MNDSRWFTYAALGIALAVIVGFAAGIGLAASGSKTSGASNASPAAPTGSDYVTMSILWNPTNGLDEYFPANLTVPAHTAVHVTITSYDDGVNIVPSMYAAVQGTVGGTETIMAGGMPTTVSGLPATGIAHTFTIMSMNGGGSMGGGSMMAQASGPMLNVVVPPASSPADPVTVTFVAYFNETGVLSWQCMAPCDPNSMATPGLMAGTVSVV